MPTIDPALLPTSTPTAFLASLSIVDAPVQTWTNLNDVLSLVYDGTYLWGATSGGIVRWNARLSEFVTYGVAEGLVSPAIQGIALDGDGHVWVGYVGRDEWSEYDGQQWVTYARQEAVERRYDAMRRAPSLDPRLWSRAPGSTWIWLPTVDGRVRAYDGATWRAYGPAEGVRSDIAFVAVGIDGRVWAVGDGVSTVREGYRWWSDHTLFSEIQSGQAITGVAVDSAGRLWMAFVGMDGADGGICRFDLEAQRWLGHLHALNAAIPRQVYAIAIDASDTVWLAGQDGATYQRPGEMWRQAMLPGETVRAIVPRPAGGFWLGTSRGIWSVASQGRQVRGPYTVPSAFTGGSVLGLAANDLGTLVGTREGVALVLPDGHTRGVLDEEPALLTMAPTGHAWVSVESGLYRLSDDGTPELWMAEPASALAFDADGVPWALARSGGVWRLSDFDTQELVADVAGHVEGTVNGMLVTPSGAIYVATQVGLVTREADGSWTTITTDDGLASMNVQALALSPAGELWVGTSAGLSRRSPDGAWVRITGTSTGGGLRGNEIRHLQMDARGTLYLVTSAGVSVRTAEANWSYYDVAGITVVHPAPDGTLWAGGRAGLYRIAPEVLTPAGQ